MIFTTPAWGETGWPLRMELVGQYTEPHLMEN